MKKTLCNGVWRLAALFATAALGGRNHQRRGRDFPGPDLSEVVSANTRPRIRTSRSTISRSVRAAASAQLTEGTVDFGASDMPMTDEQIGKLKVKPLHFPTVLGAVVLTYNIPGVTATLKFSRRSDRRHLPGQDHEMERREDCSRQPGREAAGDATSSWSTVRTAAAPRSCSRIIFRR